MTFPKPSMPMIRDALREAGLRLAHEQIEFLAEGWEFWAYKAGKFVLRFPRPAVNLHRVPHGWTNLDSLRLEGTLLPELSSCIVAPIPDIQVYEDGPNNLSFSAHPMIPGEPVLDASRRPGPDFARDLGALIRQIESFPVDNAVELGVPYIDGDGLRLQRSRHYEAVIRSVFPVVSCEARMHIEQVFEAYLNDDANFDFEPRLVHQDLDMNVLIDTDSGELSGVIDWGGAIICNPAIDLWLPTYGFKRLHMETQTTVCLEAAGLLESLPAMQGEIDFIDFNFPLTDILSGLNRRDEAQVEDGIRDLNASLPRDLRCPD